ncbi:WhiB family transcriptional regulator [Kitasatospora sp. GAS204B]|uniref:WhiB family transcriptional regulator n=1 Tax=unclassified Kitasatospora TaxID=2633591 RepID=UPI002474D1FE|nr:WhiB family transcriptional regulator [Kitasatospora sp. GAS204B]MDH6117911.1 WhiB family redox-sensing transcriptional regulator [Kitasatospora sp. GAS204B]
MPKPYKPLLQQWAWQQSAACRGMNAVDFYSPHGERRKARREREARARRVCASCPVLETCAQFALHAGEPYGVWGGLSEGERRELTRRACHAPSGSTGRGQGTAPGINTARPGGG